MDVKDSDSLETFTDEAEIVPGLQLEKIPPGTTERFWVHIVSNGLGRPFCAPVIVARGASEGPVFGITAVIHGNELNGIPVVHHVVNSIDPAQLKGTLVGVVVANVPSYLGQQRNFIDGVDLNHIFPGKQVGNVSQTYAHRLMARIVRHFDYLIDLHTASFGRINSLYIRANLNSKVARTMAMLQHADIIVNNAASDGTLRHAAEHLGIHAITVEIGNPLRFQRSMIQESVAGVLNTLSHFGMISNPIQPAIRPPVVCRKSYWLYTTSGGILEVIPELAQHVAKGERIATVKTIFGDIKRELFAPEDGVIIGRSVNPVNQSGSRILHLGIPEVSTDSSTLFIEKPQAKDADE